MSSTLSKCLRPLAIALGVVTLAALACAGWCYTRLRASLPQLDGTARVAGLTSAVTIERDELGVPTVSGGSRADVALGLGYLHAQDRFFQMDVLRRRGAGELAELLGSAALTIDKSARQNGFRAIARQVVERLSVEERAVLAAYAVGVNAGLAALQAKPFEYYILRSDPQPWRAEDCILIYCALTSTLQDNSGSGEHTLDTLREIYGPAGLAFFAPLLTPEDAALDGSTGALAAIPGPEVIDLRASAATKPDSGSRSSVPVPGSNSFAVAGSRTTTGAALLENDMHLDLSLPNTWFRASLVWGSHRVTGVTIPGQPLVAAGSNGHVAWGFTSARVDTSDLVRLTPTAQPGFYQGPGTSGQLKIDRRRETIQVRGASPVAVDYDWTIWGPIVGTDIKGRRLAFRWVAYDPGAINFGLIGLETAGNADEALAAAKVAGVAPLNFMVADSAGHIGWTIASALPKRVGFDGRLPDSWADGTRRWEGLLPAAEVPSVKDPQSPYLWTANNRILGGPPLVLLGDGGYVRPWRAVQIRDDLAALPKGAVVTPRDLLAVALDDRAVFLEHWRQLLLETLTPAVTAKKASRGELRAAIEKWEGRASVDSVSYPLVAAFHEATVRRVLDPIFARCVKADPGFNYRSFSYEDSVWTLVNAKPVHLLDPGYANWDQLLVAAADDAVIDAQEHGGRIATATWGKRNILRMVHPLSRALPAWLAGWLSMPAEALPGDTDMPRIQSPTHGASERFAVSPGHEDQGIFEMPGGQSGHPLSPFFRAGHEAWVRGEPTPFLPGKTEHTLILQP